MGIEHKYFPFMDLESSVIGIEHVIFSIQRFRDSHLWVLGIPIIGIEMQYFPFMD